jgi:hypothetical protein
VKVAIGRRIRQEAAKAIQNLTDEVSTYKVTAPAEPTSNETIGEQKDSSQTTEQSAEAQDSQAKAEGTQCSAAAE